MQRRIEQLLVRVFSTRVVAEHTREEDRDGKETTSTIRQAEDHAEEVALVFRMCASRQSEAQPSL